MQGEGENDSTKFVENMFAQFNCKSFKAAVTHFHYVHTGVTHSDKTRPDTGAIQLAFKVTVTDYQREAQPRLRLCSSHGCLAQ